jgi:hypothetical protein
MMAAGPVLLSQPLNLYVCYSVRAEKEVQAGYVTIHLYASEYHMSSGINAN